MPPLEGSTRSIAWLGLGSNLGDGRARIDQALNRLGQSSLATVLRVSPFYLTRPWGVPDQDDFTNAVVEVSVDAGPQQLLGKLQDIEQTMGRNTGGRRWGPRCIDLDLLLFNEKILVLPGLTVPHPRMHKRAFVLVPLFDLEPDLLIPARGTVRSCLARLGDQGIRRLANEKIS